jgi:hypothetical protein
MLCLAACALVIPLSRVDAAPDFTALLDSTELVVHIDLAKIDGPLLRAAAKTTFAGAAATDQEIQEFDQKRTEAWNAGVRSVLIQLPVESLVGGEPPLITLDVNEPTNPAAIRKLVAALVPHGDDLAVVRIDGRHLSVVPASTTQPSTQPTSKPARRPAVPMKADRRKLFDEAAASTGDVPVMVLFTPSAALRAQLSALTPQLAATAPPPMAAMLPKLVASPWMALSLKVGDAPAIRLTLAAADEASAKQVSANFQSLLDMIRDSALAKAGGKPEGGIAVTIGVTELLRPTQDASQVRITIEGTGVAKYAPIMVPALMRARDAANQVKSASNLRMLGQSVLLYSNENNGKYPDKLEDLKSQFDFGSPTFDDVTKNPRSTDKPGYIYVKPAAKLADVRNPSETPVFFESLNGKKNPDGLIGYADGHVASVSNPVPTSQRAR